VFDESIDKFGCHRASPQKTAALLNTYRAVIQGNPSQIDDTPLVAAFCQILSRVNTITSKTWRQRHRDHWEAVLQAFQNGAENSVKEVIPNFRDYLQMRRHASGTDICFDWVEAAGHFEPPASVHVDPILLSMRVDAVDVVSMTNDILSARKEWNDKNTDNIIHVLVRTSGERKLPIQGSFLSIYESKCMLP
jgi:hypothetical protein